MGISFGLVVRSIALLLAAVITMGQTQRKPAADLLPVRKRSLFLETESWRWDSTQMSIYGVVRKPK
jgi:hypothetical protein